MIIVLDTNVVLDYILAREPLYFSAEKIIDFVVEGKIKAAITANSVTDIYYVVTKKLGDVPAREALRNMLNLLHVIGVNRDECISALDVPIHYFEDALVIICAKNYECDLIVSNDKEFLLANKTLAKVISPDTFLTML